jgi:GNAT superfamily N-acetyltransferase
VFGFYLHSRAWGSGIGDLLMQACTDQLRDDGFARAVLWVLRENPRARRFYERHGWQPSGNTDTIATAFGQTLPWPLADVEYAIELANPVK